MRILITETGTNSARMQRIGYDPFFAPGQFPGKQHIGQFTLGVGFQPTEGRRAAFPPEVIKIDLPVKLCYRRYIDYPGIRSCKELRFEQVGKQEMPQMIDTEVPFKSVIRQAQFTGKDTSIIDQYVQSVKGPGKGFYSLLNGSKTGQIQGQVMDIWIFTLFLQLLANCLSLGYISAGDHHLHPLTGQFQSGSPADTVRSAGDEYGFILHNF